MYRIGQKVVYGVHGVCHITDIETKIVDRKKIPYFVLEPLEQPGARYYIPKENPVALSKISPLLTVEELEALLNSCVESDCIWIEDENHRKQKYRELICSGDRRALILTIKGLHMHRKSQTTRGKKFHLCDETFLRDAEKLICGEFSLILDKSREETAEYIWQYFQDKCANTI